MFESKMEEQDVESLWKTTSTMNQTGKNTVVYKYFCLLMCILHGKFEDPYVFKYWYKEGTKRQKSK